MKPTSRPLVSGFKPRYRVGDTLNMTCELRETFPAANITWFVNGQKVRTNVGRALKVCQIRVGGNTETFAIN